MHQTLTVINVVQDYLADDTGANDTLVASSNPVGAIKKRSRQEPRSSLIPDELDYK
jgi:hypothetical protein